MNNSLLSEMYSRSQKGNKKFINEAFDANEAENVAMTYSETRDQLDDKVKKIDKLFDNNEDPLKMLKEVKKHGTKLIKDLNVLATLIKEVMRMKN